MRAEQLTVFSKKLEDIPSDLHRLFPDILTRDSRHTRELLLCIQWLLFAKDPLNPEQLYFAIHAGTEDRDIFRCGTNETPLMR